MDDYNAATITSAYQNLKVEQDNTKETNDDITKAFTKFIKEVVDKYKKDDFFNISLVKNYDTNNSDFLIKLDDSNNYVIINTYLNIYDFEVINNNYVSNTQNKINKIENNKIICIETSNLNDLFIKFKNPYNYEVTLSYNNGFITKMNKIGE